jgi:hypothetical protein
VEALALVSALVAVALLLHRQWSTLVAWLVAVLCGEALNLLLNSPEIGLRWSAKLVQLRQLRWCTNGVQEGRICCRHLFILHLSPAKQHIPRVEPRGFEPLTSAVQRRSDTFLERSRVCKIAANTLIFLVMPFSSFQEIYSGCCTVAAQVGNGHRVASALVSNGTTQHWP